MTGLFFSVAAAGVVLTWGGFFRYGKVISWAAAAGQACGTVLWALMHYWTMTAIQAAVTVIFIWLWWRRRKDRKRALAAWGHKALARLAEMVATLKERTRPRPVLRPERIPA